MCVYKKFLIPKEFLKRRKADAIGFMYLSPLSPVGLTYCSELNDYLRKVLFFEGTPNQHLNTYSLKDITDSFSWGLSEGRKGEISEMLNTCHKLRVEMNEQHMQLWSINQKTTNGCYSSKCIWSNMNKGTVSLTVLCVCVCAFIYGPQRASYLGGKRDKHFCWHKWNGPQVRPADVYGLAKCQSGPDIVGGQYQRGTILPTNANTPSNYYLYLSQNHSFPVCFLVTVTITSFKNSLPYIIRQTAPNLCFGPDALTDKILADCILIFSRDLDLKNKWIMLL